MSRCVVWNGNGRKEGRKREREKKRPFEFSIEFLFFSFASLFFPPWPFTFPPPPFFFCFSLPTINSSDEELRRAAPSHRIRSRTSHTIQLQIWNEYLDRVERDPDARVDDGGVWEAEQQERVEEERILNLSRGEATTPESSFGTASTASYVDPDELQERLQEALVRQDEDESESEEFGDFQESGDSEAFEEANEEFEDESEEDEEEDDPS